MNKEKGDEEKKDIMNKEKDEKEKEKEDKMINMDTRELEKEKEDKTNKEKDDTEDKMINKETRELEKEKEDKMNKEKDEKEKEEINKIKKDKVEEENKEAKDRQTQKPGQDKGGTKEEKEEKDRFKDIFKYYKRRKPPPDLSQAIDVNSSYVEVQPIPATSEEDKVMAQEAGLTPPHTWTVHRLINHPGLVVVRNPFTRTGQLVWASQCLRDMARPPHNTNLASHGIHLNDNTWWHLCRTEEGRRTGLREKLRWVTLGYHHDWDTKEYSEDNRSEMPESVVKLCGVVARVLGLCGGGGGGGGEFKAQAGIINYYHHHSTLSPHTDHSEPYMEAPLLSFSFGQSAVFLLGGYTKATMPSAILLHSGDIVVMGGAARLCYHAVPRILVPSETKKEEEEEPWAVEFSKVKNRKKRKVDKQEEEEWEVKTPEMQNRDEKSKHKNNDDSDGDDSDLPDILHYLRTCRINMNIRQVLPPSMDALPS